MSPCRCLLMLTLTLSLVGCASSSKTMTRDVPPGAEFRTGLPLEPGYAQQFGLEMRWARSIALGRGQSLYAVRPLGDLLVTVERPDNVVTALRLETGELLWKTIVGEKIESLFVPTGDDEFVYVNSSQRIYTLNRRNGDLVEVANLPFPVMMSPLLVDGIAIFGSVNGKVYGYDLQAGFRKWTYGLRDRVLSTPVQRDETIFVADASGQYANLVAKTGELRWRGQAYGPITTNPVIHDNDVIIASDDQSLYSLNANSGADRWPAYRSEVPLSQTPTVVGESIYLSEPGQGMTVLNARTGQPMWRSVDPLRPVKILDGNLIATLPGQLVKIDPVNGRLKQSVPVHQLDQVLPGPDDGLILVSADGDLLRVDPR